MLPAFLPRAAILYGFLPFAELSDLHTLLASTLYIARREQLRKRQAGG